MPHESGKQHTPDPRAQGDLHIGMDVMDAELEEHLLPAPKRAEQRNAKKSSQV